MVPGEQSEAAVSYLPSANAFGMLRTAALEIRRLKLDDRYWAINSTHDNLLFDCPLHLAEECKEVITEIMQRPNPLMVYKGVTSAEGLSVEAECKMGRNKWELH